MQVIINQFNRPEIKFTAKCYREGSWGSESIGKLECSVELFDHGKGHALIEFCAGDNVQKNCIDYDGVFSVPKQAIKLLKSQGFKTSEIEC
jgi:hypothetical protein